MDSIIYYTAEGEKIIVEVEPVRSSQGGRVQVGDRKKKKSETLIENSFTAIQAVATGVIKSFKTERPSEIEMRIGLKLTGEANAVITKTAMEGNIEVTVKWKSA